MKLICFFLIAIFAGLAGPGRAFGQAPRIISFSRDGALVCNNLQPDTEAVVEYTTALAEAPSASWNELETAVADATGTIQVSVPMNVAEGALFLRVLGIPLNPDPARLIWISPGSFVMGSPIDEAERTNGLKWDPTYNEFQHQVTLTRGFWMGKLEVTQGEYFSIMNTNPAYFNGIRDGTDYGTDPNRPVERVSWVDATNYCALLTAREQAAGRLPAGYQYRLPTEAEWEYVCRAGTTTALNFGEELRSGMANFDGEHEYTSSSGTEINRDGEFLMKTTPVGSYTPNPWGLYDMHGNVWEWCLDWYGPYPQKNAVDPTGPTSGLYRVDRGGGWEDEGMFCRSAYRNGYYPTAPPNKWIGLRVVVAAVGP